METVLSTLELENGISVQAGVRLGVDVAAMRTLVESGVAVKEVAKLFKLDVSYVKRRAKEEHWLTPAVVGKMRREIAQKQESIYKRTGKAANVCELKAQVWEDRGERLKEKTFEIVQAALEGVTPEKARKLIQNPLGLQHVTNVARQITGEEASEAAKGPQVAVNIGFLRSAQPVPVAADAVDV